MNSKKRALAPSSNGIDDTSLQGDGSRADNASFPKKPFAADETTPQRLTHSPKPTAADGDPVDLSPQLLLNDQGSKQPQESSINASYRDFADAPLLSLDPSQVPPFLKGGRLPFPGLLHQLLQQAGPLGYTHICSWQPHGRAFCIHRRDLFETVLLRKYFQGQNEYAAFHRQLNMYGFQRITTNNSDCGSFYHECFLRGRLDLAVHIPRFPVKGTKVRRRTNQEEEPNFVLMRIMPDSADNISGESADIALADEALKNGPHQSNTGTSGVVDSSELPPVTEPISSFKNGKDDIIGETIDLAEDNEDQKRPSAAS